MKKLPYLLFILVVLSCRTGLHLIDDSYYLEPNHKTQIPLKAYALNGFDIYVFNICEKLDTRPEVRFCECPEAVYDSIAQETIQKVEELYLLKHKKTDLVIYLTTFSHKYIRVDKGFLNDREHYENSIVLDQIETAYIGRLDELSNLIYFPSGDQRKDIILHYDPVVFPKELLFTAANMATAENDYSSITPFPLTKVFNQPFSYKKRDYQLTYYENKKELNEVVPKLADTLKLFAKNNKVELSFSFINFDKDYKMGSKRIKYLPNFYLIQE